MKMFELAEQVLIEGGFMGRYEGELIPVKLISRTRLPRAVEHTVLRVISDRINSKANIKDLRLGVYNDVQIPLFGQLIAFLNGSW